MPIPPPPHAKKVAAGDIYTLYEWNQEMFDGSVRKFECVTRPDTVRVIPFIDSRRMLLLEETQPGREESWFNFPGGRIDPNETAEQAALRELEEETGYHPESIKLLARHQYTYHVRYERFMYLAKACLPTGKTNPDCAGERQKVQVQSFDEIYRMALEGVFDPYTALAIIQMNLNEKIKKEVEQFLQ